MPLVKSILKLDTAVVTSDSTFMFFSVTDEN